MNLLLENLYCDNFYDLFLLIEKKLAVTWRKRTLEKRICILLKNMIGKIVKNFTKKTVTFDEFQEEAPQQFSQQYFKEMKEKS
jgi:hypothetical protein